MGNIKNENKTFEIPAASVAILEGFKQALIDSGRKPSTIRSYYDSDTLNFVKYYKEELKKDFLKMTRDEATGFLEYLARKGYKRNSINKAVNSLIIFNRFLISEGLMEDYIISLGDRIPKVENKVVVKNRTEGVKIDGIQS